MTGSIVVRGKNVFALVLDLPRVNGKRRQKWTTFKGTRKEAQTKLNELLHAADTNQFVEASKLTVLAWLRSWVETSVKPPMRRPATYRSYQTAIEHHLAHAPLGSMLLQKVRGSDIEFYFAHLQLSPGSVQLHNAVLHTAFKKAVRDRLLSVNPCVDLERQRPSADNAGVREHCWSAQEAQRFLAVTRAAGPQEAAYFRLALDTGARKSELDGLLWTDVNLDDATLTITKQLDKAGVTPAFGPTKTKRTRTVVLGAETVLLLSAHKRHQATLKMANRTTYQDHGLVFAKEAVDLVNSLDALGQPICTLGDNRYEKLMKQAGVKRIKFHGLRHTCCTLLLGANVPVHVVSQRVGHKNVAMTLNTYAHAMPNMQADAAGRLGALLHG
jgi:integrase